jgi:hypothetical protein
MMSSPLENGQSVFIVPGDTGCRRMVCMRERTDLSGYVKTTEKAFRKTAQDKQHRIDETADWMKQYLYSEWPDNPAQLETVIREKVSGALTTAGTQDQAFTAWVLFQMASELIENKSVTPIWKQ